jgi:hypothetical protein
MSDKSLEYVLTLSDRRVEWEREVCFTVRDGIHKDLPLGRAWQGVVRACTREAERGTTARDLAAHALATDAKNEVSKSFVDDFVRKAGESAHLLPGFTAFTTYDSTATPLESEITLTARRLELEGVRDRQLAKRAFEEALRDRGERRSRQIAQHCAGERSVARAAKEAIQTVELARIVEPLLKNELLNTRPRRRHINLDEDLTAPQ